jgi:hypothetical protein
MAELGHSRRFDRTPITSGLTRETGVLRCRRHVSKVPCADIFFEANLVISRAARFKRTTKILRRELVHER